MPTLVGKERPVTMWRFWHILGFATFFSLRADPPKIVVGTDYCCTSRFEFSEVEVFARRLLPSLSGEFYSLMIVPENKRGNLFFGGTSEISVSSCFASAVGIRSALSHAYLFKTPLGIGLHHWDSRAKSYRSVVLSGRDIYQERFTAGHVAWIGDYEPKLPQLWLVSAGDGTAEQSLRFAKEVVGVLQLSNADVYLRSDPYLWRPDKCPAYTVPLQWRTVPPLNDHDVSRVTIYCRIRTDSQSEACITFRSQ